MKISEGPVTGFENGRTFCRRCDLPRTSKLRNVRSSQNSGRKKQNKNGAKEPIKDLKECRDPLSSVHEASTNERNETNKCEAIHFDEESNSVDNKEIEKLINILTVELKSQNDESTAEVDNKCSTMPTCKKKEPTPDQKEIVDSICSKEKNDPNVNLQINLETNKVKMEIIGRPQMSDSQNKISEHKRKKTNLRKTDCLNKVKTEKQITSKKGKQIPSKGDLAKKSSNQRQKVCHILDLPNEILTKILKYLPYFEIGKYRLVCKRFEVLGADILNNGFKSLQQRLLQWFQKIKRKMPRRESARRHHPLARESDIIETLHTRLTLLQMSFGKHIEKRHCCFFAGEILDEILNIMKYVKTVPSIKRAYKVTDELFDLTNMAMEYFREQIEPSLPEINYFSSDFTEMNTLSSTLSSKTSSTLVLPGPSDSKKQSSDKVIEDQHVSRLKQKLKMCLSDVTSLKKELKLAKEKLADQQKQLIEFGSKFELYDKKYEESACRFSLMIRECQSCKKEFQAFRQNYTCPPAPPSPSHITVSIEEQESPNKFANKTQQSISAEQTTGISNSISLEKKPIKLHRKRKLSQNHKDVNKKKKMSLKTCEKVDNLL